MSKKTIFLSHSSKDIDKVRKIRDILEALEYEPLLFHMKCLDDDNETLEDFIKKEIDARNIFVYCKSKNSESSIWVQKELAYIKESSNKRLYEIDIEKPLSETLVDFLHTLANIIKKNKVFISCSHADRIISDIITSLLEKSGYEVIQYNTYKQEECEQHEYDIISISKNGIFLPIITKNFLKSVYCMSEIEKVLYDDCKHNVIFKPVCVNILQSLVEINLPVSAKKYKMHSLNDISIMDKNDINGLLSFIEKDNRLY